MTVTKKIPAKNVGRKLNKKLRPDSVYESQMKKIFLALQKGELNSQTHKKLVVATNRRDGHKRLKKSP